MMARPALAYARETGDQLVEAHIPLVRRIAWHVHGSVSNGAEVEDLIQAGLVALVEAARGYEDRGHAFASYATTRIRGSMIDLLRRHSPQTRTEADSRRKLEAARAELQQLLGRFPSAHELAERLGLGAEDYARTERNAAPRTLSSLDEAYADTNPAFADSDAYGEARLDALRSDEQVAAAIASLAHRDQQVLHLYFVEELNLDEIGQVLGVTPSRVCQLKSAALKKVRERLG